MKRIYLDYNATTPVDPRVLETIIPYFSEKFGNPSSSTHSFGIEVKREIKQAQKTIADYFHAESIDDVIFTSGATESNNLVIKSIVGDGNKRRRIITTPIEHESVLRTIESLGTSAEVVFVNVDGDGLVDLDDLKRKVNEDTALISIIAASNEIGTIQPLAQISEIAREFHVPFHSDVTQYVSFCKLDLEQIKIDYITLSGHKIYAPKGVGLVVCNDDLALSRLSPQIFGGGQQNHLRSGTLNVTGIIGIAKAIEILENEIARDSGHCCELFDAFISILTSNHIRFKLNGSKNQRIKNNINFALESISSLKLMNLMPEFSFSNGSACSSGSANPSYVLKAIGCSDKEMQNSARISYGRFTSMDDIKKFADAIVKIVRANGE